MYVGIGGCKKNGSEGNKLKKAHDIIIKCC